MAFKFQWAFLGPGNNYMASLTKIGDLRCPAEAKPAKVIFFRLPQRFQSDFKELSHKHYVYDVRGHDFLSFAGQTAWWTDRNQARQGHLIPSSVIFGEISQLRTEVMKHGGSMRCIPESTLSLGPDSGSFFLDVPQWKLYRWARLPRDLDATLQTLICENGYGDAKSKTKITNVSVNSIGGWILQAGKNHKIVYGGIIPDELKEGLSKLGKKISIVTLALNHQHPTEYMLVLDDGKVYCSLHPHFEPSIHTLLAKWATEKKIKLQWNFTPSTTLGLEDLRFIDARYYYRRGLFFLRQQTPESIELAYGYLREAHTQDFDSKENSETIRIAYARALIALRDKRRDPILGAYLARSDRRQPMPLISDGNLEFRNEYTNFLETIERVERTRERLELGVGMMREWLWESQDERLVLGVEARELHVDPISAWTPLSATGERRPQPEAWEKD